MKTISKITRFFSKSINVLNVISLIAFVSAFAVSMYNIIALGIFGYIPAAIAFGLFAVMTAFLWERK